MNNKIIFTDLDGTLTLKDTYTKFVLKNLKLSTLLCNLPTFVWMGIRHTLKMINDDDVKKITFHLLFKGYDTKQSLGDFAQSISWNPLVLEAIEKKREEGYSVVIVTASPDVYVRHICEHLGYDAFISTQTLEENAKLTGAFLGKVCNFEEKPKRIEAFLDSKKLEHSIAYGNSKGDYAMLRYCDESYFVKKLDIKRFEN